MGEYAGNVQFGKMNTNHELVSEILSNKRLPRRGANLLINPLIWHVCPKGLLESEDTKPSSLKKFMKMVK